ncbi:phosphate permease [Mycena latifolia]|nr:phosphate permease [Mycena latifolia]
MATNDDDAPANTKPEGRDTATILNNLRIAALAEVDNANLIWFHVKVCFVAGAGFFTDAYDLFAINIAVIMLGYVYGRTPDHNCRPTLNNHQNLALKIATPVGNLFGQLVFGWLADIWGRKRMYGVELIIMIVGTFAQATAGGGQAMNIIAMLIFWRFIVGLGIGGDYPLSATISSEFASTRIRGRMMAAVFAAQGWGNFGKSASLAATIITLAFRDAMTRDFPASACTCDPTALIRPLCTSPSAFNHVDYTWRLLIGLGCVPAALALYFRLTIPETPRFTLDIELNVMQATMDINTALRTGHIARNTHTVIHRANAPRATRRDFLHYFGQWQNLRVLIGTAYSWFAIDVAFYTLGLNASVILEAIGFGSSGDVFQNLYHLCIGNLILGVGGLIPGYWLCFLFIDRWGRRPIQLMGFAVLTVLFIVMGTTTAPTAGTKFFVFMFCLANLFQNFGPNTTTFIIPGEIFPTRYRSTAHGISAATGKLGAIVAQVMFEILAGFMATGVLSTLLVPETKGKSLEVLSNEDQMGFIQDRDRNRGRDHDSRARVLKQALGGLASKVYV